MFEIQRNHNKTKREAVADNCVDVQEESQRGEEGGEKGGEEGWSEDQEEEKQTHCWEQCITGKSTIYDSFQKL